MRETRDVVIDDDGIQLTFRIQQMPATRLEDWLYRAAQVVGNALDIPSAGDIEEALGKNLLSALMSADYSRAKPLLDDMLGTASRVVDGVLYPCTIDTVDGYIGNVTTLMRLRLECLKVNLVFLPRVIQSISQHVGDNGRRVTRITKTSGRSRP